MQRVHLIRRDDDRPHMSWKRLMKVNVHQIPTHGPRRFDENEAFRPYSTCHPCSDAVARHRPRVRKRIGLDQPSRWRQNRHTPCAQHPGDFSRLGDELTIGQPGRNEVGELVHGQYRHPVCRIITETKPAIHLAHSVGERSASRHNQQPASFGAVPDRGQRGIEMLRMLEGAAAELHNDLDNAFSGNYFWQNHRSVTSCRTVFSLSIRHYQRPSRLPRTLPTIQATRARSSAGAKRAFMDTTLCE